MLPKSGSFFCCTSPRDVGSIVWGIDQQFLNSPICSPKRPGAALVCDYYDSADPDFKSGNITILEPLTTADWSNNHGGYVAGIVARFLPAKRTGILKAGSTPHDFVIKPMEDINNINGNPVFVVNFSLCLKNQNKQTFDSIAARLADILKHSQKIMVAALGNESQVAGIDENLFLPNLINKLPFNLRKYVIYVGASCEKDGKDQIDTSYSNLVGRYGAHAVYAPSGFKDWGGTSVSGTCCDRTFDTCLYSESSS